MQTFHYEKRPIVPAHCLWVSGLLLVSGYRAGAGLPLLHRVRHPAGTRLAMGDKAPGAWGAPGADPSTGLDAGLLPFRALGMSEGTVTAQTRRGSVSLHAPAGLLWGAVTSRDLPVRATNGAEAAHDAEPKPPGGASAPSGDLLEAIEAATPGDASKRKVMFIPKPEPWGSTHAASGGTFRKAGPASFFGKAVTFSPAAQPAC
jgi:hypothetical protein